MQFQVLADSAGNSTYTREPSLWAGPLDHVITIYLLALHCCGIVLLFTWA